MESNLLPQPSGFGLPAAQPTVVFESVLYPGVGSVIPVDGVAEPPFFHDLNIDQIVAALALGRDDYNLVPIYRTPAHDLAAVYYRHEIFRDLEADSVVSILRSFSRKMRSMRDQLQQIEKLHYTYQKERVFVEAVQFYCDAVSSLTEDLGGAPLGSTGLMALRDYLRGYIAATYFRSLQTDMQAIRAELRTITYLLLMGDSNVTVSKFEQEQDYGAIVTGVFEKFRQDGAGGYRFKFGEHAQLNHVEAGILDFVAQLHPDIFARLDRFYRDNKNYADPVIGRFDREIQFFLSYVEYMEPLKAAGLAFCYPAISADCKAVRAYASFDIALAHYLLGKKARAVTNDFKLEGAERIFVVSGPNQGGKTTFARMFGQLHFLGRLGCPVPGTATRLYFYDELFTHFEKEEDIHTHRGKLEDDLVRICEILNRATPQSLVILNEIFTSTTLRDALFLGRKVLEKLIEHDLLCVCVTFMDELSRLGRQTVSVVSTVVPNDPARRTFRLERRVADGRSFALSLAERHGLTYQQLRERLAP